MSGCRIAPSTVVCLVKLGKPSPDQLAQAFKAAGEKNPDVLSHKEAQRDHGNLEEQLAAAPKEIRQLKKEEVWAECLKPEASGKKPEASGWQVTPQAWAP